LPSPHKTLYWQFGDYDDASAQWAVREGSWKLLGNPKDPSDGHNDFLEDSLFLTNLETDPSESENLATRFPERVDQLKQLHDRWLSGIREEMQQ
jgi:arylsulfatase A-like enzyme